MQPAPPPSFALSAWRAKYGDAMTAVGGEFIAAVMERYGACSDDLCRLAALACGDGDREMSEAHDGYFTAPRGAHTSCRVLCLRVSWRTLRWWTL